MTTLSGERQAPFHSPDTTPEGRRNGQVTAPGRGSKLRGRIPITRIGLGLAIVAGIAVVVYEQTYAPVAVQFHRVTEGTIVEEVLGTGTLEAHFKATISSKIGGRITEVLVDQGDRVTAGQVLIRLEDTDFKQEVETEAFNLTAREAAVARLQAEKKREEAALDLARLNFTRAQTLERRNAATVEEVDQKRAALRVAEAEQTRAGAGLGEGQKQVVAAEKTHKFRVARLADTVIRAPADGLIVRRDRDPGDIVVPGSSVLAMVLTDEIWASTWVDETAMARIHPGQPARVVFRCNPSRTHQGTVTRLGRETDRESREFLVDVTPERLPDQWAVGQRVEVYIAVAEQSHTTVMPLRFLTRREGRPGAYVAVAGHARWRPLTMGLCGSEAVEVIAGVSRGDLVLLPADPKATSLTEGRRVQLP